MNVLNQTLEMFAVNIEDDRGLCEQCAKEVQNDWRQGACSGSPAYQTGGKSAKGQCAGTAAGTNPQELINRNERKVASLKRKLPFFFCLR